MKTYKPLIEYWLPPVYIPLNYAPYSKGHPYFTLHKALCKRVRSFRSVNLRNDPFKGQILLPLTLSFDGLVSHIQSCIYSYHWDYFYEEVQAF